MSEPEAKRPLPGLRRYLLFWFALCTIVMVVAYTALLDYYLDLGINLRTESFLERTSQEYMKRSTAGERPELPLEDYLAGYRNFSDMPLAIQRAFSEAGLEHGSLIRFVNVDFDDDDVDVPIDTGNLCPEGDCQLLYLYAFQLDSGDWLYLLHGLVGSEEIYDDFELIEGMAIAIGGVFTAVFLLVAFLCFRSIAAPLSRLERWSASLNEQGVAETLPNLRFRELDALAGRLQFAFERIRDEVDKEQRFLRHASHELRTPVAILSANIELLDRLISQEQRTDAEQAAILRQYRALQDISQLMETLLWINRQTETPPKSDTLLLRDTLDDVVDTYRYLIESRPVELVVSGAGSTLSAPTAAVRVVLSNLVRNAFQYTVEGQVSVMLESTQVRIENRNSGDVQSTEPAGTDDDYGFGLGLELVGLICERMCWHFEAHPQPDGWITTIRF